MSRLIDIDDSRNCYIGMDGEYETWNIDPNVIAEAQSQRKTGKWIERNPQNSDKCRLIECDKCGFSHIVGFNVPYEHWIENRNFCERCGADMRGDKDEPL